MCFLCLLAFRATAGQDRPSPDAAARIRDEALNHSQIMNLVADLTDVTGPRLSGSPNLKRAEEYARDKLRAWGLANAHLESWGPFGRGWELEEFTANVRAPQFSPLIAYPKAWSPGTNGTVRSQVVLLDPQSPGDLEKYKGKLKGKIVLFSPARRVDPLFAPPAQRRSDEELQRLASAEYVAPRPFQYTPERRAAAELEYKKWQLIESEGAAVVLQPSSSDAGTVYVTAATVPYPPDVPFDQRKGAWDLSKPVIPPQVVVSAEQYNRIVRLVARGIPVELEVNIAVRFFEEDPMNYNVVAEIPGSDLKDEVVMLGGCIDSWHAATGATDNAAGAATALEVIRIIRSLELKPRRTIRIGLWSAEEQGALGSRAYVAAHLGSKVSAAGGASGQIRIQRKPEYEKFDAYFNFDYGSGRIRGIHLEGNSAAKTVFQELFEPLRDLGVSTASLTGVGGDHLSFDAIGLPGFQWIRDYMEGQNTRAAHTNMDTYEHVLEDDLKQSAAVAAYVVYQLAMREEKLPRKPAPAY